ncbi:phosphoglycerate mutase-like protein AT74 [Lycium ferocissimum]|uniref:phosphoglycerate mutase-like protein AT74 n=1 Tax=Lycium ferocissimum TaxID=112874 RepID=UPI002815248E|nr:phosphoglycerate mutase-like protein AT74 [Lycium ferocissimum]
MVLQSVFYCIRVSFEIFSSLIWFCENVLICIFCRSKLNPIANPTFSGAGFLESLWRDIDMNRLHHDRNDDLNLVIISHGLASRVFLMKWFKWTVEQFEYLNNLGNCEFRVIQLGLGGEYSLAVHHTEEEMLEWGLSPEMISDQKWRAHASRSSWNDKCSWYLDAFFDHLANSDDDDYDEVKSNFSD